MAKTPQAVRDLLMRVWEPARTKAEADAAVLEAMRPWLAAITISGVAGEIAQKCVNYRIGLAVLGDVSEAVARSVPLRDWIRESNKGRHIWFLADAAELAERLARP